MNETKRSEISTQYSLGSEESGGCGEARDSTDPSSL